MKRKYYKHSTEVKDNISKTKLGTKSLGKNGTKIPRHLHQEIVYDTCDAFNLKSINIEIKGWTLLLKEIPTVSVVKLQSIIKYVISNFETDLFHTDRKIVDFQHSPNAVIDKRTFLLLEITLFVKEDGLTFKDPRICSYVEELSHRILDRLNKELYYDYINTESTGDIILEE